MDNLNNVNVGKEWLKEDKGKEPPEYPEDMENPDKEIDVANRSYYQFDDFEVYEIVEAICQHYNPKVAAWIGQAIQYISRAPRKNGKEDIGKAKEMIERAYEVWED